MQQIIDQNGNFKINMQLHVHAFALLLQYYSHVCTVQYVNLYRNLQTMLSNTNTQQQTPNAAFLSNQLQSRSKSPPTLNGNRSIPQSAS